MATSQDGERAERLTNTLFGQSSGARSGVDEFASHGNDVAPELRFQWRVDGLLPRKTMVSS